ncbi:HIT-type Zinc finger family protein, putative isoform 3, partial [Theobroma cacao]
EEEESSKSSTKGVCEECKNKASKYKCPGCYLRTCSLPCINAHKHRTGCNGRRNNTRFVPLSQFDDNLLLSDYNLLEETKRVAESARRTRSKLCSNYFPHFKLPFVLRTLRAAAASRRTKLLFLPAGMSKRETNQTRFHQRVHEDTTLCSVIENHLKPGPWNHPLRPFCQEQLDCLKFFIRKYPKGPKSPFQELDMKAPIRQQLADTVILEYPVIHVFLPSEHYEFEVVRENHSVTHRPEVKDSGSADNEIQKGVTFKEEKIEEDDSSLDPQVFDLMKHVISSPMHQIPYENKSEKAGAGNRVHSSSQTKDSGVFQGMEFDFDQDLIDAYSDLIAEINPDDFLDLEGEFAKQSETEHRRDLSNSRGDFFSEELEEGEIVD